MLIRISLGMLSYVFVSLLFGKAFDFWLLVLSILFVLLPLADFIPYLLIRKKYKLVSHYLWYFPLVYVPTGAFVVYLIFGNKYCVVLFAVNSLAHFIHATFQTPIGLQWHWPFSKISISFYGNKLRVYFKEERVAYLKLKYEEYVLRSLNKGRGCKMRTVSEELSDRRHPRGWKTILLLIFSFFLVLLFCFLN